jgi:hypothetical protein
MNRRDFLGLLLTSTATPALARWDPKYADLPPEVREFFNAQNVPGTNNSCCNSADGASGEEDRRYDEQGNRHYWTRFTYQANGVFDYQNSKWVYENILTEFMEVPDNAVLKNFRPPPNLSLPIVWWYIENGQPKIRCYAPEIDA